MRGIEGWVREYMWLVLKVNGFSVFEGIDGVIKEIGSGREGGLGCWVEFCWV